MIKEYPTLPDGDVQRRWFKDEQLDIVVWVITAEDLRFELTYLGITDGLFEQRVIRFSNPGGLSHFKVPADNKEFPTSKMLEPLQTAMPLDWIRQHLMAHKGELPDSILDFIVRRLGGK